MITPAITWLLWLACLLGSGRALGQDGTWRVAALAADQAEKLAVVRLEACKAVPYFGACVAHPGVWQRSEKLYLYVQPEGLQREKLASRYRLALSQDLILLDAGGHELWRREGVVRMTRETQSPLLDVFATNRIDLTGLPIGAYQARVVIHDEISGAAAQADVAFLVGATTDVDDANP